MPHSVFEFDEVKAALLSLAQWRVQAGECWAVLGRNGSGKQQLTRLLTGELPPASGLLRRPDCRVGVLSFERQQQLFERELRDDDSEFMEGADAGTTVAELLATGGAALPAELEFLGLHRLLQRGYRQLSSGEARKVLLAQQWLSQPSLLILDEPFDSLDVTSRAELADFFANVVASGRTTLLFLLNTEEDLFPWHSHLAVLERGQLIAQGPTAEVRAAPALQALLRFDPAQLPPWPDPLPRPPVPDPLIVLRSGTVAYDGTEIFRGIELTLRHGSHTLLTGPNGSGKSTLLGLLTGDHPQCYGNDLTLFGQRRGSGETIWELKQRLGIVSPQLHRDHRVAGSTLQIIVAGFFDTIGLYDQPSPSQLQHAERWLALVGLGEQRNVPFKHLSYGEQRLALVARALVKQPLLLILDEPTQGLDDINRCRVLYFLEQLAHQQHTTVVMASHRQDEFLPLFRQHVALRRPD